MVSRQSSTTALDATPSASPFVVRTYALLGVVVFASFGILRLLTRPGDVLAYAEIAASCLLLLAVTLPGLQRRVELVKNVLLVVMLLFIGIMLWTGGVYGAGILWLFPFPVAAFFLAGQREGRWWVTASFVLVVLMGTLAALGIGGVFYDAPTFLQLAASVLVVTLGLYAYQVSRERLVSETHQSWEQLEAEKIRADIIVQSLSEGVIVADAKGVVTYVNRAAEQILGWREDELLGKNFIDTVPVATYTGSHAERTGQALHSQPTETVTARAVFGSKDSQPVSVVLTQTPFVVSGKIVGVITTLHDAREEEAMARSKSEFITLASHQLRTPISAISWTSELLLEGDAGALSPEQRTYITDIYQSNKRMGALVGEMLIVSSLDLRSLPVIPQQTDLPALAAMVIKEQAALYKAKKQHITQRYGADLPQLNCDAEIVKLILRNVLSNAFKYTPSGGDISLQIDLDARHKLSPGSKGSVMISVHDSGFGIPASASGKIFTKFFRAENIQHKDTDGTGLGLYVVKSLLEYVGGEVRYTSKEGAGTTFHIALPLEGMEPREVEKDDSVRVAMQLEEEGARV